MLFASVFNAILVFIVRKSRVLWKTSTIRVRRAMRAVTPDRIRLAVSAFASNAVQICQRHFMKAIIPFIPLTADLKDGHEESVNWIALYQRLGRISLLLTNAG